MTPRRPHTLGSMLALLALVMQLGFGASLPRSEADAVLAAATLCHSDDGGAPSTPHTPDCALCPVCMTAASVTFALPADAPPVPLPRAIVKPRSHDWPLATAPPASPRVTAQPRGPPIQA